MIKKTKELSSYPLSFILALHRQERAQKITERAASRFREEKINLGEKLSRIMMHPLWGIPILLGILFGMYEFVGVLGAQVAVDFLEEVFGRWINPWVNWLFNFLIPYGWLRGLFAEEYGIITLGVRYAVAIILPIVSAFFFVFSIIEDSGYLPRLAMFVDRFFKKIGLSGRAVIPMVLGFGCDTMATLVTRTLGTKRERIICTLLLSLAIPCSAQLGVMLALLGGNFSAFFIWTLTVALIFFLVGWLATLLMPGRRPLFYMELPPLRVPKLSSLLIKTWNRVRWYFIEVLPLFVLASVFIWVGKLSGVFELLLKIIEYPVRWAGIPREAAFAFLFGFFRRDYGAAGLYDLKASGILSGISLVVAVITLTLFVPCVAQFSLNIKERGFKTALGMILFISPFAFLVGFLVNFTLTTLGVRL